MHGQGTPVIRKKLVDPAACGVRLGLELRAAAERAAYGSGMCLSHWIKGVVEEALFQSASSRRNNLKVTNRDEEETQSDPIAVELNTKYAEEMEKLNDR